ncbi:hypothetical protein NEOLI_004882 [Neolecta irregularis DAH-3]|uniref:C2H2-type domain-containing protein n=1 Tax=Neolecta irregularis (strain DAH-3) TaxID=1198029 RepID=A0A1U7LUX8_NEOID|nr:hypothetical protein NEOLI_004882 [Neolecta irregularis DAH-3]|eukprot:OLL26383.1 hypothetical protein NEOLI_004882 [Neolecta irregularis DAH-3]
MSPFLARDDQYSHQPPSAAAASYYPVRHSSWYPSAAAAASPSPPHFSQYSSYNPSTNTLTTPTAKIQTFNFVPIPSAQPCKRPRRRYDEIERIYKCGWEGCEKAYGTLNHLNAHVAMQGHGCKRLPDEFKEIRATWKAKKKAEEEARKKKEKEDREAMDVARSRGGVAGGAGTGATGQASLNNGVPSSSSNQQNIQSHHSSVVGLQPTASSIQQSAYSTSSDPAAAAYFRGHY